MALDGAADVDLGVLGVTLAIRGEGHVGHRLAGQLLIEQERQNRMIVRSGRQLDLSPFGELAVQGDHLGQQVALLVQEPLLLVFGVVPPLGFERGQLGVFLEQQRVDPGQVRPDLKVAEVAGAESSGGPLGGVGPRSAKHVQLMISRVRPDHRVGERHEEVVEQVEDVLAFQAVDRLAGGDQVFVGRAFDVSLKLAEEAGDEIDCALELGDFLQVQGHSEVVFGGVEPHPRHRVFAGDVVRVVWLVLMPHQG